MRSPKNRLKLTGDTHPPEVEFDLGADEDVVMYAIVPEDEGQSRIYADGFVLPGQLAEVGVAQVVVGTTPRPRQFTPWLAVGAMLAFGLLVSRLLRR
jgi:hypothetical protein